MVHVVFWGSPIWGSWFIYLFILLFTLISVSVCIKVIQGKWPVTYVACWKIRGPWFMDVFQLLTWPLPPHFHLCLQSSSQGEVLHAPCMRQIWFIVETGLHMFRLYCYFSSFQFSSCLLPQCQTTSPHIQVNPYYNFKSNTVCMYCLIAFTIPFFISL